MVKNLRISRVEQRGDYWCWAACGEMVGRHFDQGFTQCQMVNKCFGAGTACTNPKSIDRPLALDRVGPELARWGLHNARYARRLSTSQIVEEIQAGRPILALISLGAADLPPSVLHLVVIGGYRDDMPQRMVYRIDPLPGAGAGWIGLASMDWEMSWAQFHL